MRVAGEPKSTCIIAFVRLFAPRRVDMTTLGMDDRTGSVGLRAIMQVSLVARYTESDMQSSTLSNLTLRWSRPEKQGITRIRN